MKSEFKKILSLALLFSFLLCFTTSCFAADNPENQFDPDDAQLVVLEHYDKKKKDFFGNYFVYLTKLERVGKIYFIDYTAINDTNQEIEIFSGGIKVNDEKVVDGTGEIKTAPGEQKSGQILVNLDQEPFIGLDWDALESFSVQIAICYTLIIDGNNNTYSTTYVQKVNDYPVNGGSAALNSERSSLVDTFDPSQYSIEELQALKSIIDSYLDQAQGVSSAPASSPMPSAAPTPTPEPSSTPKSTPTPTPKTSTSNDSNDYSPALQEALETAGGLQTSLQDAFDHIDAWNKTH